MSIVSARIDLARRIVAAAIQRRSVSTIPKLNTEKVMTEELYAQTRARIGYQKQMLMDDTAHIKHEMEETAKWTKMFFYVAVPVCSVSFIISFFVNEHEHRIDVGGEEEPEYMKIREKELPWKCDDCDVFDGACWKKCRENK